MKIVVATMNGGLDDNVSPVFGRCSKYTITECDGEKIGETVVEDNPGFTAQGGAGIQAAQFVAEQNADYVVAGNFGPKAAAVLSASNIKMIQAQDNVKEAVEKVISGELKLVKKSTVQEHFGMRGRGGFGHGHGRGGRRE